jgi:hypothetical protein
MLKKVKEREGERERERKRERERVLQVSCVSGWSSMS